MEQNPSSKASILSLNEEFQHLTKLEFYQNVQHSPQLYKA